MKFFFIFILTIVMTIIIASFVPYHFSDKNYKPPKVMVPIKINLFQGEIKLLKYKIKENENIVNCDNQNVNFYHNNGYLYFFISAQYNTKNEYNCLINDNITYKVKTLEKDFPTKHIKTPQKYRQLTKLTLERIKLERKEKDEAYKNNKITRFNLNIFKLPNFQKITSIYGEKIIDSNKNITYHTGIDYGVKIGTDIKAFGYGQIILRKNLYYCGNTIIISHGLDLYSVYCHLNKIKVDIGEFVDEKSIIGTSGNSGLSTGPHLHFAIKHLNNWIDPEKFIKLIEKNVNI